MAEFRTVRMAFWVDPFVEELEAKEKLLYIYLFTCPHTNNLGLIEVTRKKIAFETGLAVAEVDKYLAEFEQLRKIVTDKPANLIWLCNFIRHQTSTSPKLLEGLQKLIPLVASVKIAEALCIRYPHLYGIDVSKKMQTEENRTVAIPYAYGSHTLFIPPGEKEEKEKKEIEKEGGNVALARDSNIKSLPAQKQVYGENGFVRLTKEEYTRLCKKFSAEATQKVIALLDLHIGAKGKDEYKSHYLALQKWVFDAVREREARAYPGEPVVGAKAGKLYFACSKPA